MFQVKRHTHTQAARALSRKVKHWFMSSSVLASSSSVISFVQVVILFVAIIMVINFNISLDRAEVSTMIDFNQFDLCLCLCLCWLVGCLAFESEKRRVCCGRKASCVCVAWGNLCGFQASLVHRWHIIKVLQQQQQHTQCCRESNCFARSWIWRRKENERIASSSSRAHKQTLTQIVFAPKAATKLSST